MLNQSRVVFRTADKDKGIKIKDLIFELDKLSGNGVAYLNIGKKTETDDHNTLLDPNSLSLMITDKLESCDYKLLVLIGNDVLNQIDGLFHVCKKARSKGVDIVLYTDLNVKEYIADYENRRINDEFFSDESFKVLYFLTNINVVIDNNMIGNKDRYLTINNSTINLKVSGEQYAWNFMTFPSPKFLKIKEFSKIKIKDDVFYIK